MLTTQQQALIKAIEELELAQVQKLLAEGLDPNFIDPEQGPPVSIICDGIFKWWEDVSEAYEAGTPLSQEKNSKPCKFISIFLKPSFRQRQMSIFGMQKSFMVHYGMQQVRHVHQQFSAC